MNQFTVSDDAGRHLGFLVMLADDEYDEAPQSGMAAAKLLAEKQPESREARALAQMAQEALRWEIEGEKVCLYDAEGNARGYIRQQWLQWDGTRLILGDLTGVW